MASWSAIDSVGLPSNRGHRGTGPASTFAAWVGTRFALLQRRDVHFHDVSWLFETLLIGTHGRRPDEPMGRSWVSWLSARLP